MSVNIEMIKKVMMRKKKKQFQIPPSWLNAYLAEVFLAMREFLPTPLYNRPLSFTSTAMQIRPSGIFSRALKTIK